MLVNREAYDRLMALWYKGYSVPKAKGRYIDMGMAFKKDDVDFAPASKAPRRKPGVLTEMIFEQLTPKWQGAKDICTKVDAAIETTRNVLEKLTKLGRIESNGVKGFKQYRRTK